MKRNILLILTLFLGLISFSQQSYTITVPEYRYQIDEELKLIVCNIDVASLPNMNQFGQVNIEAGSLFTFESNPGAIDYRQKYTVSKGNQTYQLYFSRTPLISIITDQEIVDEPKRLANFTYGDENEIITSFIGIEIRGGASQSYPKKTYDLEFWGRYRRRR